ncbi:MAG: glycerol-3-phosphate 1-O-acyltransferase PlsY [Bdellovibrionales bacterium]|jgi:glycerol-3-phosphate acyltransferase PlsY|nr:glycerol-3-phosphate 1-O-acyltransferase PlsY [Bdellovibrionales bacterium]
MSFLLTQSPADLNIALVLVALIGGYLSGSVPYGLILSRIAGLGDIRNAGSGNIGATNVLRLGGKKLGAATLLLDALKGAVPVLIAKQLQTETGHLDYAVLTALAAFTGHLFPIWLKFKGGKGVATALGICWALMPLLGLILCLVWLGTAMMFRYSSLAALVAFGVSPVVTLLISNNYQMTVTVFILAAVVWIRHHQNIRRLWRGEESKINLGSKKKEAA